MPNSFPDLNNPGIPTSGFPGFPNIDFPTDIIDFSPSSYNPFPGFPDGFPDGYPDGFPDGFFDDFTDGFPDGFPDFSDFPDIDITDMPDIWSPIVCEDDKKKCEKYAKKNKCNKKDKYGEEYSKSCKKSCYEFLPEFPFCFPDIFPPTDCKDDKNFEWKEKSCKKIAKKKKCYRTDEDGEKLHKSCRKSCGKCTKPPTLSLYPISYPIETPTGPISGTGPTQTPSGTGCKDVKNFKWKGKNCKQIAEKDKCSKSVDGKKLRKSCKESCDKCPKPPTLSLSPISFTETPTGPISGTGPTETPTGGTDLDPTTSPTETLTTSPTKTLTTSPTKTLTTSPTITSTTSYRPSPGAI